MSTKKEHKPRQRNSVLRNQALLHIAIILLGFMAVSALYNSVTLRTYHAQTTELAGSVLRQTNAALSDKIEQYRHIIELTYLNTRLQSLLFNEYYYDAPRAIARSEILTYLEPMDRNINDIFTEISAVTFYTDNLTLGEESGGIVSLDRVNNQPWAVLARSQKTDRTLWLITTDENGNRMLSAIRALRYLRSSSFPGNFLGYLKMDFNLTQFFSSILPNTNERREWLLITDSTGGAVASTLGNVPVQPFTKALRRVDADRWTSLRVDGENYLVSSVAVNGTDWNCWYAVNEATLTESFLRISLPVLLLALAMAAVMAAAAWLASSRLAGRIGRMADAMADLEQGRFERRIEASGHDEVSFLAAGLNRMAARLDEYVTREYRDRIRQREYDIQALQGQLHPHFLYNSLASISWLGMQTGSEEIPAISNALARFYRLSLSRGRNIIPVADEADQARAYLDVMAIRYRDRIHAVFRLDEDIKAAYTLKLVLQPFVENALLHGMNERKNRITIIVSARCEGGELVWQVIDDGVGMDADRLARLENPQTSAAGYGVANVHRRIQMHFGSAYGVQMHSEPGVGTAVRIRMPLLAEPPPEE